MLFVKVWRLEVGACLSTRLLSIKTRLADAPADRHLKKWLPCTSRIPDPTSMIVRTQAGLAPLSEPLGPVPLYFFFLVAGSIGSAHRSSHGLALEQFQFAIVPTVVCSNSVDTVTPIAMSSEYRIQRPYVLATLPRPLDHTDGKIVAREVYGQLDGQRKRKRTELAVGVDGETTSIYDVRENICTQILLCDMVIQALTEAGIGFAANHVLSYPPSRVVHLPALLHQNPSLW